MIFRKNKTVLNLFRRVLVIPSIALLGLSALSDSVEANGLGPYQTPQDRELYNTSPGSNEEISILDASNPLELMNRLRRLTAMDDATSPSDAVDEALKALELED